MSEIETLEVKIAKLKHYSERYENQVIKTLRKRFRNINRVIRISKFEYAYQYYYIDLGEWVNVVVDNKKNIIKAYKAAEWDYMSRELARISEHYYYERLKI